MMKMEKIQERALRFVCNDFTSSYANLLLCVDKPSLYLSRLRKLSIEVFKITSNDCPPFISDLFSDKSIPYHLRDKHKLEQPVYSTITYGKNSLRYEGAKLWNMLPPYIKGATSVSQFNGLIRKWLGPSCSCSLCILCHSRI